MRDQIVLKLNIDYVIVILKLSINQVILDFIGIFYFSPQIFSL